MNIDTRAKDIQELDKLREDGEGDEALSDKAIEVADRIERDRITARQSANIGGAISVQKDLIDFEMVIADIRRRRHAHVLDKYFDDAFLKKKARDRTARKAKRK